MASQACQRWREGGRPAWRHPADGVFSPARYGVDVVSDTGAKRFVETRHYSRTYVAAVLRYGLYDLTSPQPALAGVAVLSSPSNKRVLTNVFPGLEPYRQSLELGRFVLTDQVAFNGESWFLGQVFRLAAAAGIAGVVSFSDPVPRVTTGGALVKPGHIGVIYQATNAIYAGLSTARPHILLPDGTVFDDRTAQKIRAQERGHDYAERRLTALGARPMRAGDKPAAWLARALDEVGARRVRHPGKHRYAFRVGATHRARAKVRIAVRPRPYPKAACGQLDLFTTGGQA